MKFLVDHNLRGHSVVLAGSFVASGWLDLVAVQFVLFEAVGLADDANDRVVWRCAQAQEMILITANRSMKGEDSLEQVMREENTAKSLPVVTIANIDRLLAEPNYRDRCVNRLVDIIVDIEDYRGARRIFIP
jgi:hypothetical protein